MAIDFEDNRIEVKGVLESAAIAFLHGVAGEVRSAAQRNSRADQGHTRGSYAYQIDEGALEAEIGSDLENAIWEEFGTGEYAMNGDGRKGGWYVHESQLTPKAKSRMKRVVGKNGEVFYFTKGKTPNRPLYNAFSSLRDKIIKMAEEKFKGVGE